MITKNIDLVLTELWVSPLENLKPTIPNIFQKLLIYQ